NGGAASVSVLVNATAPDASVPVFGGRTDLATAGNARAVALADFNADGRLDVAAEGLDPDAGTQTVSVFLNLTDAGVLAFTARTEFEFAGNPHDLAAADINQDGLPDLVVASPGARTSVLLNTTAPMSMVPQFA